MTDMNYFEAAYSNTASLSYRWNAELLPPGDVSVIAIAYDINNNRSELAVPVMIKTTYGRKPDVAPLQDYFSIIANTYSRSMNIMRGTRAPANNSILVDFTAARFYNGIVVHRSAALNGPYALLGQSALSESGEYKLTDYAPDLAPATTVYYKIAYFNRYGAGPFTDAIPVRILPAYKLNLVSPANNTTITDTTPRLLWECTPIADAQRTDWIYVRNVLDATIITYSFVINTSDYLLPELLNNNTYEWDVRSYYEYINSEIKANVLSRSFPGGKGANDLSANGAFSFTVIQ
jgi:hypothetical protein